jgi:N-formylglutamate deformylase
MKVRKIKSLTANHTFIAGISPLVVTAIHEGHQTRDGLKNLFNLNGSERLREEDPFTASWLSVSDNRITVHHSRFEADVNRPPDKAVYRVPDDAWGLKVWKQELPADVLQTSQRVYDDFYEQCTAYFDHLFTLQDKLIVYDIHSYNHRRESGITEADPAENPEINIGTKNMDRQLWDPVIGKLTEHFRTFNYDGRNLDARENIKFKGGYFGQWLYKQYGKKICPISIEFKKFFMDEWTGEPFERDIQLIDQLLQSSKPPVLDALKRVHT